MITNKRQGFTLIEILIVVAIIAILASVVLVGLGPTQQAGRDARRLSDIREVQNGLELYYNKCGFYPGTGAGGACGAAAPGGTWTTLQTNLVAANIGLSSIPFDPSANRTYAYAYPAGFGSYLLGVALENANNSVVAAPGYTAPATAGFTWVKNATAVTPNVACAGVPAGGTGATYCIAL